MNTADKDVLAVLRTLATAGASTHQARLQAKHAKQTQRRLETQLELLADEVEQVMPRSHPLFEAVLLATAMRKVSQQHEPEEVYLGGEDW